VLEFAAAVFGAESAQAIRTLIVVVAENLWIKSGEELAVGVCWARIRDLLHSHDWQMGKCFREPKELGLWMAAAE